MKLNRIIFPLIVTLAAVMATTGCKHGFSGKVTNIPNHKTPPIGETGGTGTLPIGGQMANGENATPAPGTGAGTQPGGGELPQNWRPEDMIPDRPALAAFTIHFAFDSAVVRDSDQASIASVGQTLTSNPNDKLLIEGNCDERGTEEYNRALGERRALAAREALAKIGIDPMRIATRSFGKDQPADPGHDESAWSKNRRDDFVLLHPKP
jgi:peptidoglycan-associated lipoprotein